MPTGGSYTLDGKGQINAAQGDVSALMNFGFSLISGIDSIPAFSTNGMVKIASGTITTPRAYTDLTLPAGYSSFRLLIQDMFFSVSDYLVLGFSQDGGSTFINDTIHYDSYVTAFNLLEGTFPANTGKNQPGAILDSTLDLFTFQDPSSSVSDGFNAIIDIFPGSSNSLAKISVPASTSFSTSGGDRFADFMTGYGGLNPGATVPPSFTRVTTIRFCPNGNGDLNPPTSGETITAGSYILWGVSL
jgi:hypothetical protein